MGKLPGLISIAGLLLLGACSPQLTDVLHTTSGPIQGVSSDQSHIFRGIPYAAPPVGDLRWRPPQPPAAWTQPLTATQYGPACWQEAGSGNASFLQRLTEGAGMNVFAQWLLGTSLSLMEMSVAEDCLTLNIIVPTDGDNLPVMFWIHGGGHQFGDGGQTYESTALAGRGVVLVTINYRLGLYGFMSHPELAAEHPHGSSGNYGMLDQIAALQWVRDNIATFGGDPDNVTIFGESAGGHSVGQLMASPLARDLFHRAIAQSGTGFYQFQATDAAHERMSGFDAGRKVAEVLGVSGANEISALRELSVEALMPAASDAEIAATLHPQIDGYVLPRSTAEVFYAGDQAPVPLIVGSNEDEGSVLYYFGIAPVDGGPAQMPGSVTELDELLQSQFGDAAGDLGAFYGVDDDGDVNYAAEQLVADTWFGRHAFYMAQQHSAAGHPTYLYFYERRPPSDTQTIGASHALELNHVFGGFIPMWPSDDRDTQLTDEMQRYWTSFADTGVPGAHGIPEWTPFDSLQSMEIVFGHEQTFGRPAARKDRYLSMHGQFERRLQSAIQGPPGPPSG